MARRIVPGDIIFCDRMLGIYAHFGIYIGDLAVVHFDSDLSCAFGLKKAKIDMTTIEDFRDGDTLYTIAAEHLLSIIDDYCSFENGKYRFFSLKETVDRALWCLHSNSRDEYNLFENNCEHFAVWCKTGIQDSSQVRNVKRFSSDMGLRDPIICRRPYIQPILGCNRGGVTNPLAPLFGSVGLVLSTMNKAIFREEAEY